MDWADEIESKIQDELNESEQSRYYVSLPSGRIASALRKAKADGMRDAAECLGDPDFHPSHDRWHLAHELRAVANQIEKGNS